MGSLVKGLFGGGGREKRIAGIEKSAQAAEQQINLNRQQQDAQSAAAATEGQLNRARRTPRGRRLLLGEAGSKLG
jgi:hypothetical protein